MALVLVLAAAAVQPAAAPRVHAQTCGGYTAEELRQIIPQLEAATRITESPTLKRSAEENLAAARSCLSQLGGPQAQPAGGSRLASPAVVNAVVQACRGGNSSTAWIFSPDTWAQQSDRQLLEAIANASGPLQRYIARGTGADLNSARACLGAMHALKAQIEAAAAQPPASEVGTCGPLRGGPVCRTQEGLADYNDWLAGRQAEQARRAEEAARLEEARQADVDLLKQVPLLREPPPPARARTDQAAWDGVCAFDAGFNCVPIAPDADGRSVVMDSAGEAHLQVNGRLISITAAEETLLRINALDARAREGALLSEAPWLLFNPLEGTPGLELSKGIADLQLWWLAGEDASRPPTDLSIDLGPEANLRFNLYREAEAAEAAGPFALEAVAQLYPGTQAVVSDRPDETALCFKGSLALVKVGTKPVHLCTPNAVAAVHGTSLSADFVATSAVQRTTLSVSEGSVVVRDRLTGQEYTVEAGASQVIEHRVPDAIRNLAPSASQSATPIRVVPAPTPTAAPRPTVLPTPSSPANAWGGRWRGTYSGTSYARDPAAAPGYQCDTRPVNGAATVVLSRDEGSGGGLSAQFTFSGAALGYLSCGPLDHSGTLHGVDLVGPLTATSAAFKSSGRQLTLTRTSAGTLSGTYTLDASRRIKLSLSLTRQP